MKYIMTLLVFVASVLPAPAMAWTQEQIDQFAQDTRKECQLDSKGDLCAAFRWRLLEMMQDGEETVLVSAAATTTSAKPRSPSVAVDVSQSDSFDLAEATQVNTYAGDRLRCVINKPGGTQLDKPITNANPAGSGIYLRLIYNGEEVPVFSWDSREQHATAEVGGRERDVDVLAPGQSCVLQLPYAVNTRRWLMQAEVLVSEHPAGVSAQLRQTDRRVEDRLVMCGRTIAFRPSINGARFGTNGLTSKCGYWGR